jgi:hypothetical protein
MTAVTAIAVLMLAGAGMFLAWCAVSMYRWYRKGPPSHMARRITDKPRHDHRSSIEQFKRIHRP